MSYIGEDDMLSLQSEYGRKVLIALAVVGVMLFLFMLYTRCVMHECCRHNSNDYAQNEDEYGVRRGYRV